MIFDYINSNLGEDLNKSIITFILMFSLSIGCSNVSGPTVTGDFVYTRYTIEENIGGGYPDLRYVISVPVPFNSENPKPLIVALHYGGTVTQNTGNEFLSLLIEPALENLEGIFAVPHCPSNSWNDAHSEYAVMKMIESMKESFNIDESKIIVVGYSFGAIGAYHYAAHYPEIFSAAIPVSGFPENDDAQILADVPLNIIHSTGDEIFPYNEVEQLVSQLQGRGIPVNFETVEGISHYSTSNFIVPLRKSVQWLNEIWE